MDTSVLPFKLGGHIEPHAGLLNRPQDVKSIYKVISTDNLIRSIKGGYLHFQRVDRFKDFPNADIHDGEQPPNDRPSNLNSSFEKSPDFTVAHYYDRARSRTYVFCASAKNTDFVWENYGSGGSNGKICIEFDEVKLRDMLNKTIAESFIDYGGIKCSQIFSINYGLVDYIDWSLIQKNEKRLPNPMEYSYIKDLAIRVKTNTEFHWRLLG